MIERAISEARPNSWHVVNNLVIIGKISRKIAEHFVLCDEALTTSPKKKFPKWIANICLTFNEPIINEPSSKKVKQSWFSSSKLSINFPTTNRPANFNLNLNFFNWKISFWACFAFRSFQNSTRLYFCWQTFQFQFSFRSIEKLNHRCLFFNFYWRCLSAVKSRESALSKDRKQQSLNQFTRRIQKISNFANLLTSIDSNQKSARMKPEFERLPKSVSPSHYDLQLKPDLIGLTFAGCSKTTIKVSSRGKRDETRRS